jgi:glycosyltransferase involved in cell wall biosynthesis
MRVWYLVPEYSTPSWGVGMLYGHVDLLCRGGFDAVAVQSRNDYRPAWLETDVPIVGSDQFDPGRNDLVVVPEVMADDPRIVDLEATRVLFVQGSFVLVARLEAAVSARQRGFTRAIAILPHVADAVRQLCDLPVDLVPPYVAPYFSVDEERLDEPRPRRLTIYAKPDIREYPVALGLLRLAQEGRLPGLVSPQAVPTVASWEIVELSDHRHHEVAEILQNTELFINLNCWEAFNTTVPEAMAAGAVPICFEAYGGRDFLRDGDNAFVFPNNSLLPLIERALELMAMPDGERRTRLAQVRRGGWQTARTYNPEATACALRSLVAGWSG